jgi:hypothetical protein
MYKNTYLRSLSLVQYRLDTVTASSAFIMQLPKSFRKQDKQESISYSAVYDDADTLQPATSVRAQNSLPSGWPADAGLITRARVWIAIDYVLLILPIAFIG